MLEAAKRDYRSAWRQLQTLPGCGPLAAADVLAEIGPAAGELGRTRKGNRHLRRILCEIAHAASRTRNAQFGPLRKDLTVQRGALRGFGGRLQRPGREAQRPVLAARPSRRGPA